MNYKELTIDDQTYHMFDVNWEYRNKVFGENSNHYAVLRNSSGKNIGKDTVFFTINKVDQNFMFDPEVIIECIEKSHNASLFIYSTINEIVLAKVDCSYMEEGETVKLTGITVS